MPRPKLHPLGQNVPLLAPYPSRRVLLSTVVGWAAAVTRRPTCRQPFVYCHFTHRCLRRLFDMSKQICRLYGDTFEHIFRFDHIFPRWLRGEYCPTQPAVSIVYPPWQISCLLRATNPPEKHPSCRHRRQTYLAVELGRYRGARQDVASILPFVPDKISEGNGEPL